MNNKLIVNADDFGLSEHNSRAIAEAFRKGYITDTTMMATGEWFDDAIELAKEEGFFDRIGIHFNLTEGKPLTEEMKNCPMFVENGRFHKHPDRLRPLTEDEEAAVFAELSAQVKRLKDAGVDITHADSHHHIHTGPFLISIFLLVCHDSGIEKIRIHRNIGKIKLYKRIVKKRFNNSLLREGMVCTEHFGSLEDAFVRGIPESGVTELMVHPDYDKDGLLIDRVKFENGVPCGEALSSLEAFQKIKKTNYRSL